MASAIRKFVPILDKVLLEKIDPAVMTSGGVLLPSRLKSRSCVPAKVIAVGGGKYTSSGKHIPVSVKEGDTVLLPDHSGTFVKLFDKEYVLYEDDELLGIIHD